MVGAPVLVFDELSSLTGGLGARRRRARGERFSSRPRERARGGPHRGAGGESLRQGAEHQVGCFDPELAGKQGAEAIRQPGVAGEEFVELRLLLGV
jgi:hypothetical protein